MPQPLEQRLASELSIRPQQVQATIALLDEGATVPVIARHRKAGCVLQRIQRSSTTINSHNNMFVHHTLSLLNMGSR